MKAGFDIFWGGEVQFCGGEGAHGDVSDKIKTAPDPKIDWANKTEPAPSIVKSSINESARWVNTVTAARPKQNNWVLLLYRGRSEGTVMHSLPACRITW